MSTLIAVALLSGCGIGMYAGIGVPIGPQSHQHHDGATQGGSHHGNSRRVQSAPVMVPECRHGGVYDPARGLCVVN